VLSAPAFTTYTALPSGVIATACGLSPTGIVEVAFVARSILVTLSSAAFATYAVLPSGVIAIACGLPPTAIGVPACRVATSIGVTLAAPTT
jgi:hypothetical protein